MISPIDDIMERLLADPTLVEKGMAAMRDYLVRSGDFRFLDSPADGIYPFATPLVMQDSLQAELQAWTTRIAEALENEAQLLRTNPEQAERTLSLASPLDRDYFFCPNPFGESLPIHRLDFALQDTCPPRLLEVNCGCPGGELDPALVAEAFMASPLLGALERDLGEVSKNTRLAPYLDPRDESLRNILRCYEAFRRYHRGFPDNPTIALITTSAQARFMIPECSGIARHYESRGHRTMLGDLLELEVRNDEVQLKGETIHLIFRKFSTDSFKRRMMDQNAFSQDTLKRVRALWEAVSSGLVCMVNPLGSTYLQDKGILETLGVRYPELGRVVLETHVLGLDFPSREPSLWRAICKGEEFVLKRRHSFGGRHVIMEPEKIKVVGPRIIKEEPGRWVAQRRVPVSRYPFAFEERGHMEVGRFPFTVSLFGGSCFVRVGRGGPHEPINAQGGGAATCSLSLWTP